MQEIFRNQQSPRKAHIQIHEAFLLFAREPLPLLPSINGHLPRQPPLRSVHGGRNDGFLGRLEVVGGKAQTASSSRWLEGQTRWGGTMWNWHLEGRRLLLLLTAL